MSRPANFFDDLEARDQEHVETVVSWCLPVHPRVLKEPQAYKAACLRMGAETMLKHLQTRSRREPDMPDLKDWQDASVGLPYEIKTAHDRIDIEFEDGRNIWVEFQDGRVRVHCYEPTCDAPMNVEIHPDRVEVDSHDYGAEKTS